MKQKKRRRPIANVRRLLPSRLKTKTIQDKKKVHPKRKTQKKIGRRLDKFSRSLFTIFKKRAFRIFARIPMKKTNPTFLNPYILNETI